MGNDILNLVLQKLREAGFPADKAYPGHPRKYLEETSAAVHIARVDVAQSLAVVEVCLVTPSSLGGVQCELDAIRAMKAVQTLGAECVLEGCKYEGMAQAYVAQFQAEFTCEANGDSFVPGPGFSLTADGVPLPYVRSFQTEQVRERDPQYAMGEPHPVGISEGGCIWKLQLEELIPVGAAETVLSPETAVLTVKRGAAQETYQGCSWTSMRRELTRAGLRRIYTGIAMEAEVK